MSKVPTITRSGYHRKGYQRKAYTRSDGTRVAAAYVHPAYVPPTKIPAKGMAVLTGHKGVKLIDMKDYRHLRDYGYNFEENMAKRRHALDKAMKANSHLWAIHRINAIRTLTKNTNQTVYNKAESDLHYAEETYKKYKLHNARESRSVSNRHH
jgi:hypothetical protein